MSARFLLGALLATIALVPVAKSEDFPTRPITLIVSFAPGGLTDVPARMLAPELQRFLGQPVVVENKAGASGVTGGSYVVHAAPDGYTLLVSGISEVQNLFYIHVPYDAQTDLTAVGRIAAGPPLVLAVNSKSPFKTVADLIAYAKANPSKMNISTTGPATSPAIAVSQLNSLAGTKIVAVPYNGSGPAAEAVAAGEVQAGFVWYPSIAGMVSGGQVRVLAIASAHRLDIVPDVPTMEELGFKNFDHNAFVGLLAPRGTPPAVIAILNKAINESIDKSSYGKKLAPFAMTVPPQPNTPEAYRDFIAEQTAYQGALAKLPGSLQQNH
jgi:tripartite-type tricarboxylate transporter receptor subunit TctC